MSEDEKQTSAEGIIRAAAALAREVPVYQDAVQPGARELGKALETTGRTVNALLLPIKGLVWSAEQLSDFIATKVDAKMQGTPPQDRIEPTISVVAPALEAVRFRAAEPDVQELFANLIASAMDARMAARTFPSFVEILKQMTSDEAKVLQAVGPGTPLPFVHVDLHSFDENEVHVAGYTLQQNISLFGYKAGCSHPELIAYYITNLIRLGLLEKLATGTAYTKLGIYDDVLASAEVKTLREQHDAPPRVRTEVVRSGANLTPLGRAFYEVCVQPYEKRSKDTSGN